MSTRARIAVWISSSLLAAAVLAAVWGYLQPISTPLRVGMTPDEVRLALTSDTTHSYDFYSDPGWCSRGIFALGDVLSYHTWIGYSFDDKSKLESAYGYHAITIDLPIIGFHNHEFPRRDIEIHK